jgi:hypothetical protein
MKNQSDYFIWLTSQIAVPDRATYIDLLQRMYDTEFSWIVERDDNRVQDALDVRREFVQRRRLDSLMDQPVSVLEVLIALSRRISWITSKSPEYWAWRLIKNLGLHKASDPLTGRKAETVEETLEALVWRTYARDGTGGFFPLQYPQEDQTKKEIWDQMNAYVNEMNRAPV